MTKEDKAIILAALTILKSEVPHLHKSAPKVYSDLIAVCDGVPSGATITRIMEQITG